ncbi:aminoglycoside phosphotransferase family protein [Aestuariimicrobium ganziense]|uniref:aminoglycoside phosphotransferase family protein n=1 Tax=Aestuariimicrobium ganziense TaxID=2773677 RepID=UPI00194140C7|nr:aminoglycoside phosphotransferase family protein [Aestuariimicrobium ganziense]
MEATRVNTAINAATEIVRQAGLLADDVVVLNNSNAVILRLLPADLVARVAEAGREVAAFEVEIAQQLQARGAPISTLDPRLPARVHHRDGFAITFWTHHQPLPESIPPAAYADALHRLHQAMADLDPATLPTPHFTDRAAEAEALLTDPTRSPNLADDDRTLLLHHLRTARDTILASGAPEQLLHGEPHPGNLLHTAAGTLLIDFETCCRGPVEFDLAHALAEVAEHSPHPLDPIVLAECRHLVLTLVAAWRADATDEFPDGPGHGRAIIERLRQGPPWPYLGPLAPVGLTHD